jgi:hypothetical protein
MPVSRLAGMAGIGVDRMGNLADQSHDDSILRLENLDTDLRLPLALSKLRNKQQHGIAPIAICHFWALPSCDKLRQRWLGACRVSNMTRTVQQSSVPAVSMASSTSCSPS